MEQYKTGSKLEKQKNYVTALKEKIELLENQQNKIEKELLELRDKLSENKDYVPEE